jgi:carboxylesterase type B
LYLDVWAPANATSGSKLPVKFWIYGGADDAGSISDPLYNGCNLATDSVVVSAAYRVGALGFLSLESDDFAGNFAVQDLLLALKWVQQNIAAFGGDPVSISAICLLNQRNADSVIQEKVLLFGQSAGAVLTWILSSFPQSPTLISAAISESGAGRALTTKEQYQTFGQTYANALGCNVTDVRTALSSSCYQCHLHMS